MVARERVPNFCHARLSFGLRYAVLQIEEIEQCAHTVVHNAMHVDGAQPLFERAAQGVEMCAPWRVEWDGDVAVAYTARGEQLGFVNQRFGVIVERQVYDVTNADLRQPQDIRRL